MTDLVDQPTVTGSLGAAVQARLDAMGRSRRQLARDISVSPVTVDNLCDGRTTCPHTETVARVEAALSWPPGYGEAMVRRRAHRGRGPGPDRRPQLPRTWTAANATPWVQTPPPVDPYKPADVMHLDVPTPATAQSPDLTLPDPALRWRSPRNPAGRVEQVERWTYALAVARILVKEAEASR